MIHPLHALLLACCIPLFGGALLADWAYSSTGEVQWINFAAWLVSGGLIFAGAALLWGIIDFLRADRARDRSSALFLFVLIVLFALGFVSALVHSKDAWATMPEGLILSVLVFLLAVAAVWMGFATLRRGDVR